jgi:biopolymer transport protein ExbD
MADFDDIDGFAEEDEEGATGGINITPLTDVGLTLVIVFMVMSPIVVKNLLPVKLPEAVSAKSERTENITISVSPEDGFAINEVPVKRETLERELDRTIQRSHITYVLIRADERIPYGEVEDIMKMAKRLGGTQIAFATVPKSR